MYNSFVYDMDLSKFGTRELLVTYLGGQVQFWHRDEGQRFQMQSLWLQNQEWLARLWLAQYIGPVGRGGMY